MTLFQQFGRCVSCFLFLAAAGLLSRRRADLDVDVFRLLFASLVASAASELASAVSADFRGSLKVFAHLSQAAAVYLVYRALINVSLTKPYDLFFRDLKRSREDLRKERDFTATVLDTTGALVVVMDREGRVVRFNRACEGITGYSSDKIVGKSIWETLLAPEEREAVKAVFHELRSGQFPNRYENSWVAKDGSRRQIAWSNTVLLDAQGAVDHIVATGLDITEQRQADQRQARLLRRLEGFNRLQEELILPAPLAEKFKKITEAAVELLDLDFCRIWSLAAGDLCDSGCIHAVAADEVHWCYRRDRCLHLMASSGRYTHVDGTHRRVPLGCYKIGTIATDEEKKFLTNSVTVDPRIHNHAWAERLGLVSFAGYKLHDGRDNPTGVFAMFAQHPLSDEDDAFLSHLAETTSKVIMDHQAEEELRQSQKLEGVGQLAGGIAHEFNNLLQAIGGYAGYAMEGLDPGEQRHDDLEQVLKATDRATALTRQLLGFSRRHAIQPKSIDANAAVHDLAKLMRPTIGEHIALDLALGDEVGTVYADAGELQQALLNLCVNARDAMPAGGALTIKTERVVLPAPFWDPHFDIQPGLYVVFTVSDTGCGIPRDLQQHIFEPFFTTKDVGKGTGLGLALVYGIVRQHRGAIHVYSELGMGTTFKLYFPAGHDEAEYGCTEEGPLALLGRETILVAEDEPLVRDLTVRTLEKAGYTVLAACDGEEALRIFRDNHDTIALVVLDAIMPKLTGHEVHRSIKQISPDTKFVCCTGYDRETARSECLVHDNVPLIQKPFTSHTLLSTVREVLDARTACPLMTLATP